MNNKPEENIESIPTNGKAKKVERLAVPFLDQMHYDKRTQAIEALSKPGALTRIVGKE